ncbi:hypothetical protein pipiens_010953 [Culex pipiens pipiens]|uniref:Reverse transcriptase n=1 Tax=Culex pipiens pipiens TaxID=38569 RepID=A0ABD1D872_CULPP
MSGAKGSKITTKVVTRSMVTPKPAVVPGPGRGVGKGIIQSSASGGRKTTIVSALTAQGSTATTSSKEAETLNRSKVAYMEPVDYEKEFPRHAVEAGRLLFEAGFKDCKEITKIGRFRFKLDLEREVDYDKLLRIDLANKNLRVFLPASRKETILFVPNVPENFDEGDILANIECQQTVLKVERIKRLRNGQLINTNNLKITVKGQTAAKSSHNEPSADCPNSTRCINCGKDHRAGDRSCAMRQRSHEINKEVALRRIPFAEAEGLFPLSENRFAGLEDEGAFPSLQGDFQQSGSPRPKGNRNRGMSFAGVASTSGASTRGTEGEAEERPSGGTTVPTAPLRSFLNLERVTEFEAFVGQLRKMFFQQVQQRSWLRKLIALREKVNSKLQEEVGPLELDRLLIEISTELNSIEELQYEVLDIPDLGPVEAVGVRITGGFDPISLFSVYLPPNSRFTNEAKEGIENLFRALEVLPGELLVGADLNGHHTDWSPGFPPCTRGRFLKNRLDVSPFVVLNNGSPTTIPKPGERSSAIDITLASAGLARKATWEVQDQEFGSCHLAIFVVIDSNIPVAKQSTKRINKQKVVESLSAIQPQFIYSPEEMVEIFNEAVEDASFVVKDKKANYLKRWWSDEIADLYDSKREALRTYNVLKSRTNYIQLQKARALFKKAVRKAKREHVAELTGKIDESTPPKQLWNIVKGIDTALAGGSKKRAILERSKGEEFMEHYFSGRCGTVQLPNYETARDLEGFEMALKDGEVLNALKRTKNHSAPGENQVSYDIIKQLPLGLQLKFAEMLSRVFATENIPERWRITEVRPIPKKGANPNLPNSWRPIALMNIEIKLINSVVKDRLAAIAELNGLIPDLSFGFRKNVSSVTCVNYVVNAVREAKEYNNEVIVAFLDVKMAYDTVNTTKLLQILAGLGIPEKLTSWLYEYLRCRVLRLQTEDGVVEQVISEGLSQGCPAAPTLYNFYTAGLHDLSNETCKLVQFADDFAVIATGASLELAEQRLNGFLDVLAGRLKELDMEVSPSKCAAIAFTGKRIDHLRVKMQGQVVQIVNTHKYLGYTLDRALKHRKHIETVTAKAGEKLGLLKLLSRKTSGANPATLVKVGNAIVRSRMEYGATIYGNAAKSNLGKLQVLQNSYIRIAMGYVRSTPIHVMLAEAGQIPTSLRTEALTKTELIRSTYFRTPLLRFISDTLSREIPNGSYLTEIADKHADILYQLHPSDKDVAQEARMSYFSNFDLEDYNFHEVANGKYKDHKQIYTDASKTPGGTALAVYDSSEEATYTESINDNYSIMNAELRAICIAVEHVKQKQYEKAVIYTDSKAACQSLLNQNALRENFIVWNIYKEIQNMRRGSLRIQWIPSHVGIRGNEIADQAAKAKSYEKQTEFIGITLGDARVLCHEEIWYNWREEYKKTSQEKGRWHFKIMENPGRNIWCKELLLTAEQIRVLNRVRSGHTMTKERRALWQLELDDQCEVCQEKEDLSHLLYMCPVLNNIRTQYNVLEYMNPLEQILTDESEEGMKQVVRFIKEAKIQI